MSQNAWPERELWARVPVLAIASDVEAKPCIDRRVSSCQKTCVHVCVCRSSYAMNDMRYKFFRFAIFLSKKCKTIKKSFRGRFGFIWRNSSLCGSDQAIAFRLMTRWMDGWVTRSRLSQLFSARQHSTQTIINTMAFQIYILKLLFEKMKALHIMDALLVLLVLRVSLLSRYTTIDPLTPAFTTELYFPFL